MKELKISVENAKKAYNGADENGKNSDIFWLQVNKDGLPRQAVFVIPEMSYQDKPRRHRLPHEGG